MRKLFSGFFAVLGGVLMAVTVVLCLLCLNAKPKILEFPQQASTLVQSFATAIDRGDLAQAGQCVYGQPDLTAGANWEDEAKNQLWQAYCDSLRCSPGQKPQATDEGIDWTVTMECLDLNALMTGWQAQTNASLAAQESTQETGASQDPRQALTDGLSLALAQERATVSQTLTLHLIYRDDQWWIRPDAALLQLLSGQA